MGKITVEAILKGGGEMDSVEKKRAFLINIAYFTIVGAMIFIVFKYGIFWIMPFVLGFVLAFILKPLINWISVKLRIKRKLVAGIILLLLYGTVGVLLFLLGTKLFISIRIFIQKLPYIYSADIQPAMLVIINNVEEFILKLDPTLVQGIQEISSSLIDTITSFATYLSSGVVSVVSGFARSVPTFFVGFIFFIISSFFLSMDYYDITGFIMRQFTPRVRGIVFDIKDYLVGNLFKIIKSYAILMSITFVELTIGLSILSVDNAVTIAIGIALLDILPVLGTGGIVIPWVIIEFLKGDITLAIGLFILYIVITIIRNIIEPKIVGQQIGLHPLVTLICMFIGVKLFGFLGIFILPLIVIVIKNLNDNGKIKILK